MLHLKLVKGRAVYCGPGPPGDCIAIQDGRRAALICERLTQYCSIPARSANQALLMLSTSCCRKSMLCIPDKLPQPCTVLSQLTSCQTDVLK